MKNKKIALIGLGYVGLPLAVEFGKKRKVIGFDINKDRIDQLKKGIDPTLTMSKQELNAAVHLSYTNNLDDLKDCSIFIVAVPTPIDKQKRPDLTLLKNTKFMNRFVVFLLTFFVIYTTIWLLGNDNLGTATRLRIPSYLVVFASMFIVYQTKIVVGYEIIKKKRQEI